MLFGDLDTTMSEQDTDSFKGDSGKEALHSEGVPEPMGVSSGFLLLFVSVLSCIESSNLEQLPEAPLPVADYGMML